MPTNDERRKIAAELRENRDPLTPYNLVDYIFDDPWNHDSGEEVASRLADLIEPKRERTCHNISTVPCKFTCSECHQSWRKANGNGAFAHCPNCGAKVVE